MQDFQNFVEGLIEDWDFDNICTAHNGWVFLLLYVWFARVLPNSYPARNHFDR
jgi:hypothetical protein